jgi:hypothetical protein
MGEEAVLGCVIVSMGLHHWQMYVVTLPGSTTGGAAG